MAEYKPDIVEDILNLTEYIANLIEYMPDIVEDIFNMIEYIFNLAEDKPNLAEYMSVHFYAIEKCWTDKVEKAE